MASPACNPTSATLRPAAGVSPGDHVRDRVSDNVDVDRLDFSSLLQKVNVGDMPVREGGLLVGPREPHCRRMLHHSRGPVTNEWVGKLPRRQEVVRGGHAAKCATRFMDECGWSRGRATAPPVLASKRLPAEPPVCAQGSTHLSHQKRPPKWRSLVRLMSRSRSKTVEEPALGIYLRCGGG